jgi:phosphoribosyl 1,2-cyclic phosphate phosphodiesterase
MGNSSASELLFLGTAGAVQAPAFFCSCEACEAVRNHPERRRTRASIALIGKEVVIVDAGPDFETQLERESIRRPDRILITHWHFDHVAGLAALAEPSTILKWPVIDLYLPHQVVYHLEQELSYMKDRLNIHPVKPGDKFDFPDASWEVVKTNHNEESVGYIVTSSRRFAYLVDGVVPPASTVERLKGLDFLILEATVDTLVKREGEAWHNFSLDEAIGFWKETGIGECIFTHLACHGWDRGKLTPGITHEERLGYERRLPGLKFAYDGLRMKV